VADLLENITGGIFTGTEIQKGVDILRVRPNEWAKRYYTRSSVSYVPNHLNKKYQRASIPGETMLSPCKSHSGKEGKLRRIINYYSVIWTIKHQ
jgi:hypothetical protein